MMVLVLFPFIQRWWPCSDETNVSLQDIKKFVPHVHASVADSLTDANDLLTINDFVSDDARVSIQLEHMPSDTRLSFISSAFC